MFNDFTHCTAYKGMDVVIAIDDYNLSKGRKQTRMEPAEPAEVEIIGGYIELDFCKGSFMRLFEAHANATDTLFDTLVEQNAEAIDEELFDYALQAAADAATDAAVAKYEAHCEAYYA